MLIAAGDGSIVAANPVAERLWSRSPLAGCELLTLFEPTSQAVIAAWTPSPAACPPETRTRLLARRPDGTTRDVEVIPAHLSSGHLQLTVRDMTEAHLALAALQESEERLRLAFAGAQEGVWDWNLDTGNVVYSHRWKEMLGYADDEIEPHVRAWERLIHPDDKEPALAATERLTAGENAYRVECRLRHKDGHYVDILSRGFPVRDPHSGRVIRIVGTHLDLTERKQAEEARRQAQEDRTRSELLGRLVFAQEDERRRIAREMHDQFGEHLTALARVVERLQAHAASHPHLADDVRVLDTVTQRLDRDVEHMVWELRPTALDDLGLRAALSNYVRDWSERGGIQVRMHMSGLLEDRLPSEVETTLYRIAQEALTNVARHAQATNVELILARQADAVVLVIEDNGIGFSQHDRDGDADDLGAGAVQGGGHTAPSAGAAGARSFGLLGMQERAALIGASLSIESTPGQGTSVLFRMTAGALNTVSHG